MSKSASRDPAASPSPTRPGKRAASHATSSVTSAGGRNVRSSGHGAAHPVGIASSSHPAACRGLGMYPANPPWCSLVMTPSNPAPVARTAWVRSSRTASGRGKLDVGVEPERDRSPGQGPGRSMLSSRPVLSSRSGLESRPVLSSRSVLSSRLKGDPVTGS